MEFTLTTPALLFPAISLLLLAYTNRYLTIAGLIRNLHARDAGDHRESYRLQIDNLRSRVYLIRQMQIFGVVAFFLCVATMLLVFLDLLSVGEITFAVRLICLLISLGLSIKEVGMSIGALEILLKDCENGSCE